MHSSAILTASLAAKGKGLHALGAPQLQGTLFMLVMQCQCHPAVLSERKLGHLATRILPREVGKLPCLSLVLGCRRAALT